MRRADTAPSLLPRLAFNDSGEQVRIRTLGAHSRPGAPRALPSPQGLATKRKPLPSTRKASSSPLAIQRLISLASWGEFPEAFASRRKPEVSSLLHKTADIRNRLNHPPRARKEPPTEHDLSLGRNAYEFLDVVPEARAGALNSDV